MNNQKADVLVCVWKPNENWRGLSDEEKRDFLSKVAVAANAARDGGMQIMGWGLLERTISNPPEQSFCGVFFVDDRESLHAVDSAIRESGWYHYFDHINVASHLLGRDGMEAEQVLCSLLGVP